MDRQSIILPTAAAALTLLPAIAAAQQYGTRHGAQTHVFRPEPRDASEQRIEQLSLPQGFEIGVFARGVENARMLAIDEGGTVYVTRPLKKDVLALRDDNGDGRADGEPRTIASDLDQVHGIAIREGRLYVATPREVFSGALQDGGSLGELETLVSDLPGGGQHHYRTLGFAPDGGLHINSGSSCNSCFEITPEKAANLRLDIDSGTRRVHAHGLRNMLGFAWHAESGDMWGVDHGVDHRGDTVPGEELNRIREGAHYGWPFCYGNREPDWMSFTVPQDMPKDRFCAERTEAPVMQFPAHSSVLDILFYEGDNFPEAYRGDAFVTLHGSFNRQQPAGYKVVRVRFEEGEPQAIEDFLTGFLIEDGAAQFGRPTGLALAPDGSLFMSDDAGGVIYRIRYEE